MAGPVEVKVDDQQIKALMRRIKAEVEGKQLRKDLIGRLREAVSPGVAAVQSKLRGMPSSTSHPGPSLGGYLAARVKPQVKLSGRSAGVRVRIGKTPNLRKFAAAARLINRGHWRHKVFARDRMPETWVDQKSPMPGFFDDTLNADRPKYRAAVVEALNDTAKRLGTRL